MIICLGTTPTVQRRMSFAKLTPDAVNRTSAVCEYASGKSTNVARVLHTLGEHVLTMGFVGGDRGAFFRQDLDSAGIEHDFVEVTATTRLCITVVDEAAGTATELIEESQPVKPTDYAALLDRLAARLRQAKLLVLSGTLPPGAPADFYKRCIELAGDRVRVILDAVGQPLLEALPAGPFIVKPNAAEISRTLDVSVNPESALREAMVALIRRGAAWVVCTRGPEPTLVSDGRSFWSVTVPWVRVVSPIGSGDAFAAGLAWGLSQGQDVPSACVAGAACGSANAMTADAGHIHVDDVNRLAAEVRIDCVT